MPTRGGIWKAVCDGRGRQCRSYSSLILCFKFSAEWKIFADVVAVKGREEGSISCSYSPQCKGNSSCSSCPIPVKPKSCLLWRGGNVRHISHSCGQLSFTIYVMRCTSINYVQVKLCRVCTYMSSVPKLRGVCSEVCIRTLTSYDCISGLFYTAEDCLVVFAVSHKENNYQN